MDFRLGLFWLAVAADVASCAAYLVDMFVQAPGFLELWQLSRWVLVVIGTTFAVFITRFMAIGMFQPLQQ